MVGTGLVNSRGASCTGVSLLASLQPRPPQAPEAVLTNELGGGGWTEGKPRSWSRRGFAKLQPRPPKRRRSDSVYPALKAIRRTDEAFGGFAADSAGLEQAFDRLVQR